MEAYRRYRDNSSGRDSQRFAADYHTAHNAYILQLRASNRTEEEYHSVAFPYLLEVCTSTTIRRSVPNPVPTRGQNITLYILDIGVTSCAPVAWSVPQGV